MKKYILIYALLTSSLSFSAGLPGEWYFGENQKSNENSEEYNLDQSLENLHDSGTHAVTKAEVEGGDWYLDQMKTILGLTVKGKLGVKSWGGKKAIELVWKKRSSKKLLEENESNIPTVDFSKSTMERDALHELEPFINSLVESGKVDDEKNLRANLASKVTDFFQMAQGVESSDQYGWSPHKIRLDLSISADGSVSGLFVKVGGDIRIRFEWTKQTSKTKKNGTAEGSVTAQIKTLVNGLAQEIEKSIEEEPTAKMLNLKEFKVGVGVSVGGKVGVAKASASIVTHVYFKKTKKISDKKQDEVTGIAFLSDDKSNEGLKTVSNERVRKGFKKAIRFAHYFQKKLDKKKYEKSSWAVHTIKPSFTFDLSGDVGVVTLKGLATFELAYINNKF